MTSGKHTIKKSIFEHESTTKPIIIMINDEQNNKRKQNRAKGSEAEDMAAEYLERVGMVVMKRNFHFGRDGEIDIIAKEGETLVFVEVKSRRSLVYGTPEDGITLSKRRILRRTAEGYLHIHKLYGCECRFDFIAVDYTKTPTEIRHIINAL